MVYTSEHNTLRKNYEKSTRTISMGFCQYIHTYNDTPVHSTFITTTTVVESWIERRTTMFYYLKNGNLKLN
jgi:hypothetical protein